MRFYNILINSSLILHTLYAFTPTINSNLSKNIIKQTNLMEEAPELVLDKIVKKKIIDIVFLSGSMVDKNKYKPLIKDICKNLLDRNIEANIYLIDEYYKKKEIDKLISNKTINNKFHIIGHSFGGYQGSLYAQHNDKIKSLVQWCSHFNLQKQLPYPSTSIGFIECPSISILAELDEKLPCTDAICDKAVLPTNHKMIVLDDFTHMSGIDNDFMRLSILSNLISDYISYIENNDIDAKFNIELKERLTTRKFKDYIDSLRWYNINKIGEKIQKMVLNNKEYNIYTKNYSIGENIFETILQLSSSSTELLLYLYKFVPEFIYSHPNIVDNNLNISLFKPFKNSIVSYIKKNEITNAPIWLKLKKKDYKKNIGKKIGEELLESVLNKIDKVDKEKYENRPIIFEDDIVIEKNPFCSIKWLLTPMSIKYTENKIVVRVPVLETENNIPEYIEKIFGKDIANSLNIKMISESQLFEWILVKCKM